MLFDIFVFDQVSNLKINNLKKCLAMQNCEVQNLCFIKNTQNLQKILQSGSNQILLCKNDEIDDLIGQNINFLSNQKSIIDEQAVLFEKAEQKILFLPADQNFEALLSKTKLNDIANKQCQFKLFGMTREKIDQALQDISSQVQDFKATVLECGLLKFEVYISYLGVNDLVDEVQVKILSAFKDFVFSDNQFDMGQSIVSLAKLKNISLAIVEGVTGGTLIKEICSQAEGADLIDVAKIEKCDGQIDSDNVYTQTLELFKDGKDIFAVNVQGEFVDEGLRCVYAIGNRRSIDVHKNLFKTSDKSAAIEFACNAIMFNIIKKLRQNNLQF